MKSINPFMGGLGNLSEKEKVMRLQALLNLSTSPRLLVDGDFGRRTRRAIVKSRGAFKKVVTAFLEAAKLEMAKGAEEQDLSRDEVIKVIERTARSLGVNKGLAVAIATIESDLNPSVVNPSSGAAGLFQILSPAIQDVYDIYGDEMTDYPLDVFDKSRTSIGWNVRVGVLYIKIIAERYLKGSARVSDLNFWTRVYGAYNLGIGNLRKLERGNFSDSRLIQALNAQARFLSSGGPEQYLAAVESKLDSVSV